MQLIATLNKAVTVYYCKAGIKTGLTVRVLHDGKRYECSGVALVGAMAEMKHASCAAWLESKT